MIKIICVCGARPNFMKIAPLMRAFESNGNFDVLLVHTGQHYDENMSRLFFNELGIQKPDINLEVGSASHAVQTAEISQEVRNWNTISSLLTKPAMASRQTQRWSFCKIKRTPKAQKRRSVPSVFF